MHGVNKDVQKRLDYSLLDAFQLLIQLFILSPPRTFFDEFFHLFPFFAAADLLGDPVSFTFKASTSPITSAVFLQF